MALQTWRFVSLMLTALLMSLAFAHLWQLPPRLGYSGPFWFQTLALWVAIAFAALVASLPAEISHCARRIAPRRL